MKIKDVLSVFLGGILLAGCSSEEEIQPGKEVGQNTSFSITLTMGEVTAMTKAGSDIAEGYTYSTEDEVKVNNVVIAVFGETNGVVGDCLDYKPISFGEGSSNSTVTVDGKTMIAYKVEGIQAKTGKVRIVAIANSTHFNELSGLSTTTYDNLKSLSESVTGGTFDASNLVKVGELSAFNLNTSVTSITVPMTQLAARIDMKFTVDEEPETISQTESSKVTNQWFYTVTKLTVKNVNQKSDLILFDRTNQYDVAYTDEKEVALQNGVALPFYTYEKLNSTVSPLSLYVTGDLQKVQVTTTFGDDMSIKSVEKGNVIEEEKGRSFKYENFNPTTAIEGCTTNGIIHGNRYELTGHISMKTQRINFTVSTTPWEGVEKFVVDVVIADLKYLFVRETKVVMANITEYIIEFASSSDITIDKPSFATYEKYELRGNVISKGVGYYYSNSNQYPTITRDSGKNGYIRITSKLPVNYFPKQFVFGVHNNDNLSVEGIVVDQYPPQYLTGEKSEGGNHDSSADYSKNPNLFTITTIASGDWIIGNPSKIVDNAIETKDDEQSNNMISPRFIVASRYAAVSGGTYTWQKAHDRCRTYWETLDSKKTGKNATYPPGKWRMPTLAELKFMDAIQEASPAVDYLFNQDSKYWGARKPWYYDFDKNVSTAAKDANTTLYNNGGARCVYDIY